MHCFVRNKQAIQKYMDNPEATYKLAYNTFHSGGSGYVHVGWVEIFYPFSFSSFNLLLVLFISGSCKVDSGVVVLPEMGSQ